MLQIMIDTLEEINMNQSPSWIVMALLRLDSMCSPKITPIIMGTKGISNFLSNQPNNPNITIMIKSKLDPEIP